MSQYLFGIVILPWRRSRRYRRSDWDGLFAEALIRPMGIPNIHHESSLKTNKPLPRVRGYLPMNRFNTMTTPHPMMIPAS
jgi:hypothetical protein